MIKTVIIIAATIGAIGTGATTPVADAIVPQTVELTTGPVIIKAAGDGFITSLTNDSALALRIETRSGRTIRIRF